MRLCQKKKVIYNGGVEVNSVGQKRLNELCCRLRISSPRFLFPRLLSDFVVTTVMS